MSENEMLSIRPGDTDYAPYMDAYVKKVPAGNVVEVLRAQIDRMSELFGSMTDAQASFRYAEGKWSLKQIVGHLTDTERVLVYRALRIARGDTTALPGFDEDEFVRRANFDERSLADLLSEFVLCRKATIAFFSTLGSEAWQLSGTANGFRYTVRAMTFVIAGHLEHHCRVIQERYLPNLPDP